MMARPPRVSIRARKPILRIRFRRCGLYVGLMTKNWKKREKMEIGWGGLSSMERPESETNAILSGKYSSIFRNTRNPRKFLFICKSIDRIA